MNRAIAIARKDWLLLLRQKSALFFVLGWPLVVAVFFGLVFGGGGSGTSRPQVAVVDLDGGAAAHALVADFGALKEIDAQPMSAEEAEAAVRRGQRVAAVVIPAGHQQRAAKLFSPDGPQVEVWIDPSRRAETAMLQGLLMQVGGKSMQRQLNDPALRADWLAQARSDASQWAGTGEGQALQLFDALDAFMSSQSSATAAGTTASGDGVDMTPLRVTTRDVTRQRNGPTNSFAVSFVQGMFWSAFGCLMTFATGLVTERTQGTWSRLRVSPVGVGELLLGKALGCFSAMLLVSALLLLIGRFVFGVPIASLPAVGLAMIASAACFTGLMMLLSTLGDNDRAVSGLSFAVMMPMAMLGGAMVPSFAMPAWIQSFAVISPVKWSVLAFEGATWRGFSLAELLPAIAIQLAVGAVAFGLGVVALRKTARTAA